MKTTKTKKNICGMSKHEYIARMEKAWKNAIKESKNNAPKFVALMDRLDFGLDVGMGGDCFVKEYDNGHDNVTIGCYLDGSDDCSEAKSWADKFRIYTTYHEEADEVHHFKTLKSLETYLCKLDKKLSIKK
jgi:hypothetical protein